MPHMAGRTFVQSFVTLLVILDPMGNIPLDMLRGADSLVLSPTRSSVGFGRAWADGPPTLRSI